MDPQVWIVGIIVVLEAYWPIVAVAALLVLGPLLGFVIVAVIGAIRTAVVPHVDDEDAVDADDIFSALGDVPGPAGVTAPDTETAGLVHNRNDSI